MHFLLVFFIFFAFLLGSVGNDVNKGRVEGVFMVKGWVRVGSIFNGTNVFIWDFLGMGTWGTGNCTFYNEYGGNIYSTTFYNEDGRIVNWREGGSKYCFNEIT